ncbi:ThiF family adenylyltransferase [Segetibacter koreensis]|uniref:ThiF family adenylyltransferase n=1 Tax=Segetibacter koreensis TaxID=398037 RepID=UPI000373A567|nr:ThiF family adenylyltransferase [Segetibacter koreensis]
MDNDDLLLINQILQATSWIKVTKEVARLESGVGVAEFHIPTSKETLIVNVLISPDFPLQGLMFVCTNISGYNHQMHNGNLCLVAAPAATIADRLTLELEKLQRWVEKYYINEESDEHYEYLTFNNPQPIPFIFDEDRFKSPIVRDYGSFTYGILQEYQNNGTTSASYIVRNLGNRESRWSESFKKNAIKGTYAGLWVKLNQPPVISRRQTIEEWVDLLNLFNASQMTALYEASLNFKKISAFSDGFILAVGYDVPINNDTEVHWETIYVKYESFPVEVINQKFHLRLGAEKTIQWCQTSNASYERMFGRGKLGKQLTDKKILIIGVGAIGSCFFKALIRGGCRNITISDGDLVEPGNVCRAALDFTNCYASKVFHLYKQGIEISPFTEIEMLNNIEPVRKEHKLYQELKAKLSNYDFIFDCSTDKYLSIMLDEMGIPGQIINLSITDEAKDLAVVTGYGNIHLIKNALFNRISTGKTEQFFVGTGCWSPTFRASFVDINTLLMLALAEMNNRFKKDIPINSFFVKKSQVESHPATYSIDYNV